MRVWWFPVLVLVASTVHAAPTIQWARQIDFEERDAVFSAAADGKGNVYLAGYTQAVGETTFNSDALLLKYDAAGEVQWTQRLDAASDFGISVDSNDRGDAYFGGRTTGALAGNHLGNGDEFLTRFDERGQLLWSQQFGTPRDDGGGLVAVDKLGDVFVAGFTRNPDSSPAYHLRLFGENGVPVWSHPISGWVESVSTDGLGNVYIAGSTIAELGDGPVLGSQDAFIQKYNIQGDVLWTRQLGETGEGTWIRAAADARGNVFFAGLTTGSIGGPSAGATDALVGKLDGLGNIDWMHQFGTVDDDRAVRVATDGLGNVVLAGMTSGELGAEHFGGQDGFVSKYDERGQLAWTMQLGTSEFDTCDALAIDADGNIFAAGSTFGALGGPAPDAPGWDGWVALIHDQPVGLPFDFTKDGILGIADLNELQAVVKAGRADAEFDVNDDDMIDQHDVHEFVTRADLLNAWMGDANLDGAFGSTDLIQILAAGTYEAHVAADWSSGDFNTNGYFDSSDLVAALADGGYEQGPRAAVNTVPEPASFLLAMIGLVSIAICRRPVLA